MQAGSLSFGSSVSDSAVSKPIFDIKSTDNKNKARSLKRGKEQERISLKEGSSLQPRRQGRSTPVQIKNSR